MELYTAPFYFYNSLQEYIKTSIIEFMKVVQGDLIKMTLEGKFNVIIHGCNCFNAMDAGIAKQIKDIFPEAYKIDFSTEKGSTDKLGTISYITTARNESKIIIVNGYTQFNYEKNGILADYDAIRSVMKLVKKKFSGKTIGYPKIGAGLAKGDWNIISRIIDEELDGEDHTLVEYVA